MRTRVVNKYQEPYDVLITRPSVFGNEYRIGTDGDRDTVCLKHKRDLAGRIEQDAGFRAEVMTLKGKTLGCVCKPQRCHGDSIVEFLELGVTDAKFRDSDPIMLFKKEHSFLSNFYSTTGSLVIDDYYYRSVEHYYQSRKVKKPYDRLKVAEIPSPAKVKQVINSGKVELREDQTDGDRIKDMFRGVLEKFSQSDNLKERLLATGDSLLVEGNWWHDNYWGRCECANCGFFGYNYLGKILMTVRGMLGGSV